jgi:hypothetical protein
MKGFAVSVLMSLTFFAAAHAHADACALYMPCGTYEGSGGWYGLDGKAEKNRTILEKMVVSAVDGHTLHLEEYIYAKGVPPDKGWVMKANFTFENDGTYTAVADEGTTVGHGICRNFICTFDFIPWSADNTMVANVNIIRFQDNKVRRLLLVTQGIDDSKAFTQRSELTKK